MAQAKPVITTDELWASAALAPNKQKPTVGKIANGWAYGEKPPHNEFNWFFETVTEMLLHIQENGVAEWSDDIVYNLGALCTWDSKVYQSLQALNEAHQPDTSPLWWEEFQGSGGGGSIQFYQYEFTAIQNQTIFTCNYNRNFVYVSVSGIDLTNSEYTATNGTSITLTNPCDAGDIVRVYSLAGSAGGIEGDNVILINSNYNALARDLIVCDSQGSTLATGLTAYTVTLPATPQENDIVKIMDGDGNAQNRPILVDRNGNTIDNAADDLTCDVNYFDIKLVYNSGNWALGGK